MEVDTGPGLVRLMRDLVIVEPDGPRKTWDLGDGKVLHVHPKYMRSPQRGTVIGIGPKVWDLRPGNRVLYGRTTWVSMIELTNDASGPVGLIFHERDILALIEPEGTDDPEC
jgi:hypothetical protein